MTRIVDFGNLDLAALRESVDLEARSDLFAAGCDFASATDLMKRANKIRADQFGRWGVNELRDFTTMALNKEQLA